MNSKVKITILFGMGALIFAVNLGAAAESRLADADPAPPLAPVGTAFTYQGYIEELGSPANGSYNLRFSLWNDPTSGDLIGTTQTKTGVNVVDGLFSVTLDFGSVFDGRALWMTIEVQGPGDPGYTTLSPRQKLTSVPYASFAYGAAWGGLTGVPAGFADGVDDDTTYSAGDGLTLVSSQFRASFAGSGTAVTVSRSDHDHFAQSFTGSSSSRGLYIENSGTGNGIWGQSHSTGGIGVEGYAGDTGFARGVYGFTGSSGGYGVYGFTLAGDGVGGESQAVEGRGVNGNAYRSAGTGVNYGVYGTSNSTDGYGGFFVNSSASGYLLAANNSHSTTELEFKVSNNGNVYADGAYSCGLASSCFNSGIGADVAERIDTFDPIVAGDVVQIDPDGAGYYRLVRTAYSPMVAGVISTSPAMVLGNDFDPEADDWEDDRPALALVGRVPVKVTSENGPINPGDLLVSSSTPGHAMRCEGVELCFGRVIGKALEAFNADRGVIQMLVMLQ